MFVMPLALREINGLALWLFVRLSISHHHVPKFTIGVGDFFFEYDWKSDEIRGNEWPVGLTTSSPGLMHRNCNRNRLKCIVDVQFSSLATPSLLQIQQGLAYLGMVERCIKAWFYFPDGITQCDTGLQYQMPLNITSRWPLYECREQTLLTTQTMNLTAGVAPD